MILGGIIVIGESSLSHRLIVTAVIFTTLIFQEFPYWTFPILIHPLYNIHASVLHYSSSIVHGTFSPTLILYNGKAIL